MDESFLYEELPGGHQVIDVADGIAHDIAKGALPGGAYQSRDLVWLEEKAEERALDFARGQNWESEQRDYFVQLAIEELRQEVTGGVI